MGVRVLVVALGILGASGIWGACGRPGAAPQAVVTPPTPRAAPPPAVPRPVAPPPAATAPACGPAATPAATTAAQPRDCEDVCEEATLPAWLRATDDDGPHGRCPMLAGTGHGTLAGVVREPVSGRPRAGLTVVASGPRLDEARVTTTDRLGRFAFAGLPVGAYKLTLSESQANVALATYPCVAVTAGPQAELRLAPHAPAACPDPYARPAGGPGILLGRVCESSGAPVGGARVFFRSDSACVSGGALTAPDGTFRVEGLPEGHYQVLGLQSPVGAKTALDVAAGTAVTVLVLDSGRLSRALQHEADVARCGCPEPNIRLYRDDPLDPGPRRRRR